MLATLAHTHSIHSVYALGASQLYEGKLEIAFSSNLDRQVHPCLRN